EAISNGQDPFYTRLLYYPNGISLTTHNIAWFNAFLWIPLQALLGGFTATNLIYIGLFALNGFAMYLLVRQLTGSQPAAFIGGLIFAFWPYLMSQAGHPNMIVVFWLPLALYFLNRTLENKRILDAVLTGVFLAIGGIGRWQLLIVGGILFGLYLLYSCLSEAHCRTKRMLMLLLLTGLVAVLLMAPFAIPIVATLPTIALSDELFREPGRTADALGYIVPNLTLTVWGSLLNGLPERLQYTHDQMEFIGITTLVLAIYGSVTKWKTARFWVSMVLVYLVLALGSVLEFGDVRYPQVLMPYRLVEDLFFFRILQASHRFNTFLGLPVAMLVALGVANLLSQLRN
ncbi:MAG: glycosyltransferase family 39 protein, partial [Anaerolineaceae bacterium]